MLIVLEPAYVNEGGGGAGRPLICKLSQNPSFPTTEEHKCCKWEVIMRSNVLGIADNLEIPL